MSERLIGCKLQSQGWHTIFLLLIPLNTASGFINADEQQATATLCLIHTYSCHMSLAIACDTRIAGGVSPVDSCLKKTATNYKHLEEIKGGFEGGAIRDDNMG